MLHQHRTAYDLWDHALSDLIRFPDGLQIRNAIRAADAQLLPEAKHIFTISSNVSRRLKAYCGITSTPLYHPPQHAEHFYCASAEDYLFFPSRLTPLKRQTLVLEALSHTRHPVRVCFAGTADYPDYEPELQAIALKYKVRHRVEWLGHVSDIEKRTLYAHAVGIIFPPLDEDYGYVTLEAMLACKSVITCTDSGGPLEFVRAQETGLIVDPTPAALAQAMDELWQNRDRAKRMGEAGLAHYHRLGLTWSKVVQRLLS
jgi:glycosyltransferase involved in cell wall biosynthesis